MTSSNSQTKKKQSFFVNMGDVLAKETEQAKSSVEEESWENREDADGASSVEESIIRDIQERLNLTVGASDDNYESDDSGTQCDCDACQQPILSIRNPHYNRVQEHWAKLRKFIHIVYKQAAEGKPLDPAYEKQIQASIHELVTFEPHLLYKQLEAQIQEWVKETELQQLENLLDHDNVDNVPLRFISGLLESYKNLMTGADLAFPFLEELQATFLSKFNMTWQLLNEHIYQACVYANPMVQNNVPIFISKLSSTSESMESNKDLVKEFLYLDDNINSVSELWAECARCLDEACARSQEEERGQARCLDEACARTQEEEERGQARRAQLEMEWKCFKEAGGEVRSDATAVGDMGSKMESCKRSKFAEESSTNQSSNKCAMLACDCMTLSQDDVSHSLLSHPHTADSPMPFSEQLPTLPTAVNHKTCPDGSCSVGADFDMDHERGAPPSMRPRSPPTRVPSSSTASTPASHSHSHSPSPHSSTGVKGTDTSSLKQSTKAKPVAATPTPDLAPSSSSSSSAVTQCRNKPPPPTPQAGCGPAAPPPRPNNCHKNRAGCSHHSHRWETIKRVASCESHRGGPPPPSLSAANYHTHNGLMTGPLDDDESDPCGGPGGGSCSSCTPPTDDSASDQSSVSNQKSSSSGGGDNRHCDCCYCEVFGHGVSGAPVSRNYQEIRERLRLLLNKKKNKKPPAPSSSGGACAQHRSTPTATEPALKLAAGTRHLTAGPHAQNTPAQPPVFKGDENISDILNFIEGKTSKDSKKAAKKARQKEKKLQEMYERKLQEEAAERAKLEAEKRRKLELLREKERLMREQQRLERELQKQNQILNSNLKALSVKNNNNESNISNNAKKGKKASKQQQPQPKQPQKKQPQAAQPQPADAASQKKNKKKNKKGDDPSPPAQASPCPASPDASEGGEVPKIVTIKRVMENSGHEPTVTITLRGATPSEDKVLYTLQNGHVCPIEEKNRQAAAAAAAARSKKPGSKQQSKKQAAVATPKRATPTHVQHTPGVVEINVNGGGGSGKTPVATVGAGRPGAKPVPSSAGVKKSAGPQPPASRLPSASVSQPAPSFSSMSVVNVKASAPKAAPSPAPQLTSATAIQISQAISSLTSSGGGGEFNIEDLQLPPGITITKVVQPPLVNGNHEENSAASSLSCDSDNLNKENTNLDANVEAPLSKKSRKKRNKQKQQQLLQQQQNGELIPSHSNLATAHPPPQGAGEDSSSPIIKMKGAMVSIRNPAVFPASAGGEPTGAGGGQKKSAGATRHKDAASRSEEWNIVDEESVFAPKDIDLDNGDIDDAERELEAFKRFCSQSVPPKQKEKVHLNIKDIVLKKKRAAISCS